MKVRIAMVSVLAAVFATAATPVIAGSCNDTWVTYAVREVTGNYPNDSGSSGDCNPDYYATNRGEGHWSSYQDLLNKVRVKKTGQGVAYIFLAPNQAVFMGHVAWGYIADDGRYIFGTTQQRGWNFPIETSSSDNEKGMVQWYKDMFRGQSFGWQTMEYTEYRVAVTGSRNVIAAEAARLEINRYVLLTNNCMDHTVKILKAYGFGNMPWPQTNWSPRFWFANVPGVWHHVNEVARGGATSAATRPVNVQKASASVKRIKLEDLAKLKGVGFVAPTTAMPRPRTAAAKKATYARVTRGPRTRGMAPTLVVTQGMPRAPKRRFTVPKPPGLPADYRGLGLIMPYSNEGTPDPNRASGQAALATVIHYHSLAFRRSDTPLTNEIYAAFPPDIPQGIQGTSWQQMERGLRAAHLSANWYKGTAALKSALAQNMPCIVLLDVGAVPGEGWKTWGGHWTVAYAYDKQGVYLSNWPGDGKCSWAAFAKAWNTGLTRASGTANLLLCPSLMSEREPIKRVASADRRVKVAR